MKIDLRSVFLTLAALAVLGAVGAGAVVGFGLYNVSARAGHLPGVRWILHTTYQQAVTFRAPPESRTPELTDAMASLGAKHFDAACRVCHSAPGYARTATMRSMKPTPPHITAAVGDWQPSELRWIVYEGVKMSGMPHWPADRPDEVWSMVAFLTRVQEGLNRQQYDALTAVPRADPRGFDYCATCHEDTGVSGNPDIPRLDILSEEYMTRALLAFRTGTRDSGIMEHAASEVPESELPRFAATFAAQEPTGQEGLQTSLTLQGQRIATDGAPNSDVPACVACHGPWPDRINPAYPSLSGQYQPYLETQLRLWRTGQRGGSDVSEIMHQAAKGLSDAEIEAVSAWYASRKPEELNQINDGEN